MTREQILDRMRKLCSRREYCESDIIKKINALCKGEANSVVTSEIISQLCRDKYIDQMRYARAFVRDKSSLDGWGEIKIKYTLRKKGIDPDVIMTALDEIDEEKAGKRLAALITAKYKSLRGDEKEKEMKLYRFGIGRGYKYDEIKAIYDNIRTNKRD